MDRLNQKHCQYATAWRIEITTKLNKGSWIKAGFQALIHGGHNAIRVEPIAVSLGISKGSFYWHFKNLAEFKSAMLNTWETGATSAIIGEVEHQDLRPTQKLDALISVIAANTSESPNSLKVEAAIRTWSLYDQSIAERLQKIDRRRLDYVAQLFEIHGQKNDLAELNAEFLYAGLIGLRQLSPQMRNLHAAKMRHLLQALLAFEINGADGGT